MPYMDDWMNHNTWLRNLWLSDKYLVLLGGYEERMKMAQSCTQTVHINMDDVDVWDLTEWCESKVGDRYVSWTYRDWGEWAFVDATHAAEFALAWA